MVGCLCIAVGARAELILYVMSNIFFVPRCQFFVTFFLFNIISIPVVLSQYDTCFHN
uniref:Uncharacterized protein n=1 Tax=Arundo donax TaxID=35708 RepID=A0A0A9FAR6_ARUDO